MFRYATYPVASGGANPQQHRASPPDPVTSRPALLGHQKKPPVEFQHHPPETRERGLRWGSFAICHTCLWALSFEGDNATRSRLPKHCRAYPATFPRSRWRWICLDGARSAATESQSQTASHSGGWQPWEKPQIMEVEEKEGMHRPGQ